MKLGPHDAGLRVEVNIAPPMRVAVTIPLTARGLPQGMAVYVMQSPFLASGADAAREVREVALEVYQRLRDAEQK